MIELHQFRPVWGMNVSPFCLKVEAYLRLAGIPFVAVSSMPFKGPKGKLPFIKEDGRVLADSGFILAHLEATRGAPLDGALSPEQRAEARVLIRFMEEAMFHPLVHNRWVEEANWRKLKTEFFGGMPWPLREIVPALFRRKVKRSLYVQGTGRHTDRDIAAMAVADMDALAGKLGERQFFLGTPAPSTADVVAYAFLVNVLEAPFEGAAQERARGHANLVAFVARMKAALAAVPAVG
jgi:glutathione S-transferase